MHLCKRFPKGSAFTNSVDPDETPLDAASHQGLRYLHSQDPVVNNLAIFSNAYHIQGIGCPLLIVIFDQEREK